MDSLALVPWITPIITAVVTYIKMQGAQKAADKAAEIIGEKTIEASINMGQKALATLRSKFIVKGDVKAQQALANVEQDPTDEDYQQKLVKETARLASADPIFTQELKILAKNVAITQAGGVTIQNDAPSYGAQGVFQGPVHFDQRIMRDASHE